MPRRVEEAVAHDVPVSEPVPTRPGVLRALIDDPAHGPLPAALLTLTVVTGLVDAVSILALGRVFVANMTGNVVFVGFALAGAAGFSLAASLSALVGFLVGASVGGRLVKELGTRRPALIRAGLAIEVVLASAALILSAIEGRALSDLSRDMVAAILAIAMGIQNAVVRHLKVADLTTTVLTMTLTGIAADIRTQGTAVAVRRVLAVATMLGGAALGAVLVIHTQPAVALAVADGLIVAALAFLYSWRRPWS
jgi:uncharacterized membrane protein YoaK (UPF0700 family)